MFFFSTRDEGGIYSRAADGAGRVEQVLGEPRAIPQAATPDGSQLVVDLGNDVAVVTLDGDSSPRVLLDTAFVERNMALSPDGRWLAYQSDESGELQVFVRPFPDVDAGRTQVSTTGGLQPLWGADGRELFYLTEEGVMGVAVETDAGFGAGTPTLVIAGSYYGASRTARARTYDIAPDGQRFLMLKTSAAPIDAALASLPQIHVVLNWTEELKARVPTGQ